jgi:hypothetical protein
MKNKLWLFLLVGFLFSGCVGYVGPEGGYVATPDVAIGVVPIVVAPVPWYRGGWFRGHGGYRGHGRR